MAKNIFLGALFLILIPCFCYCETVEIDDLIEKYSGATELTRVQIENTYKNKTISVGGTIKDVVDWDTFDERTDTKAHYYKVIIDPRTSRSGIIYETLIFYKDKAKVEAFNKGQNIEIRGIFVRIIDEVGSFSVWVYGDELTPEDKVMLGL